MYLLSVDLINWRSYRNGNFQFQRPHGDRNVTLITAPNEYGKTSLFEALTLGLFGKDGLILTPRARITAGDNSSVDRLGMTYSKFLEGVLHRHAIENGSPECVVKLEWEDGDGEPVDIKRTWHFSSSGKHKASDDQLLIFQGRERSPVAPPATVYNRDDWYREWIAQRFLQPSLANFFLFDGEQAQRYADRDMSRQVRDGIEGLLGLPILHSLKQSLTQYAQNRRTSAPTPPDNAVSAVELEIDNLSEKITRKNNEHSEASMLIQRCDMEIDDLTRRLGGRGEGTVALVKGLMEDEHRYDSEADRAINDLMKLIAGDIALAIAGAPLRNEAIARLKAEAKLENWDAGRREGDRNLSRFAADLSSRIARLAPPIDVNLQRSVIEAAKAAWEALWQPPPEGCADNYLHVGQTGMTRARTIEHLISVGRHSAAEASNHVQRFDDARRTAELKKRERLELQRVAPEMDELAKRLGDVSEQRGRLLEQRSAAQREIDAATASLNDKRAELGRYAAALDNRAPTLLYAERAESYARLVDDLLKDAVPFEVGEVAKEMTKAWKAMAHMSDRVDRIDISSDCTVRMLTPDGSDLHEVDKSAGASQVFTQALITAITKVSGRIFPFVVDTPLARLSRDQRLGVLKTFTDRSAQVILLSTDQEVVEDKLEAIRHRIGASYELRVKHDRGATVTTVHDFNIGDA